MKSTAIPRGKRVENFISVTLILFGIDWSLFYLTLLEDLLKSNDLRKRLHSKMQ